MFRKKLKSKALAFVLAVLVFVTAAAGCETKKETPEKVVGNSSAPEATVSAAPEAAVSDKPVKFSMLIGSGATAPLNEEWLVLKEIEKRTNVTFDFQIGPTGTEDYRTKVQLLLNSGNAPDIITSCWPGDYTSLAQGGLILPTSDYFDEVPNFKKLIGDFDLQGEIDDKTVKMSDGTEKYFVFPGVTDYGVYDCGPVIRKDVLDELGLPEPKTFDELYTIMKQYKQKDPDSLPMNALYGIGSLLFFTSRGFGVDGGWTVGGTQGWYYDQESKQYEFCYANPKYKEVMEYFSKLNEEGLIDPEIVTETDAQWKQKMTTGKSIVTFCWFDQLEELNADGKKTVGDKFELIPLLPLSGGTKGTNERAYINKVEGGWMMPASIKDSPKFDTLLKLIDWMYSEEGIDLTAWGVEGTTYNTVNGQKAFTDELKADKDGLTAAAMKNYGLASYEKFNLARTMEYKLTLMDKPLKTDMALKAREQNAIGRKWEFYKLTPEQQEEINPAMAALYDYAGKEEAKFIFGKGDLAAGYDVFLKELERKGLKEVQDVLNKSLAEEMAKRK